MNNYKRLLTLLEPYKTALILGAIFLVIASLTNLAVPLYIKKLVDVVIVQKDMALMNSLKFSIAALFLIQLIF